MIELAAGLGLLATVVLGALLLQARGQLRKARQGRDALAFERAAIDAALDTLPLAGYRWPAGRREAAVIGVPPDIGDSLSAPSFAGFKEALLPSDSVQVETALRKLQKDGIPIAANVATRDGATYRLDGRRTASGDTVLWLSDTSSSRRSEEEREAATTAAATLQAMFEAIPLPIWRRNDELILVACNDAYAAAVETPRQTALAEARELAPHSGRDKAAALARRALSEGIASERRHVVIGGSRRLLEVTEARCSAGGTVGFAVDRTDVETVEGELSRHINAHAEVLESIHAAVAIYGADQRLKFFNSAFARLWGLDEEWLGGEPSLDEVLERLRERRRIPEFADFRAFKHQQMQMFTSLIEPHHELMHLPDDRTLSLAIAPHPFGGLTFIYEDVTDRLALERSYNTLTEVQRETLDRLFEGIAVYGSDGRLKLHNPAFRTIWHLSESDVAGEPHIGEIVEKTRAFYDTGGDWPALKEAIIARITAHTLSSGPLDRQDSSVLRLATVPLPDGNVLVSYLDVTDTARFERALGERNEALETAGRLKSEFIANVSYELRTPLNAIIGFAEILTNQYFGALTPRQLDYSRGILESSHRLMLLINDILDLASIEAGYMILETGRVDIHAMMEAVITLTHERARNQNLDLSLRCAADIGTIEADERRLKQALFNLVSNAIKFTPAGGSITVGAEREASGLVLSVADSGVGIPAADHARIFEKFERSNLQNRHSGAGLGLSLVKNLIELHGGTVEIESAPGQGTTVRCRLPLPHADVAEAAEPPELPRTGG